MQQEKVTQNKKRTASFPRPGVRGRPPKAAQEKASEPVGPYRLTPSEKQQYEKLFKASRLNNQAMFFRKVIFFKYLKIVLF